MIRRMGYRLCVFAVVICAACISTTANSTDVMPARDIEVKLKVPDAGWRIQIQEVHQTGETLLVISSLIRHPGPAAQVISTISDHIRMDLPDLPVEHFILGKTWKWENKEPYTFINGMDDITGRLEGGQLLYRRSSE